MPSGVGRHIDHDSPVAADKQSLSWCPKATTDELMRALIANDRPVEVALVPSHLLNSMLHVEPIAKVGSLDVTRVNLTQLRALVHVLEKRAEKIVLSRWRGATMKPVGFIEFPKMPLTYSDKMPEQPPASLTPPSEIDEREILAKWPMEIKDQSMKIKDQPMKIKDQSMEIKYQRPKIKDQPMEIKDNPFEMGDEQLELLQSLEEQVLRKVPPRRHRKPRTKADNLAETQRKRMLQVKKKRVRRAAKHQPSLAVDATVSPKSVPPAAVDVPTVAPASAAPAAVAAPPKLAAVAPTAKKLPSLAESKWEPHNQPRALPVRPPLSSYHPNRSPLIGYRNEYMPPPRENHWVMNSPFPSAPSTSYRSHPPPMNYGRQRQYSVPPLLGYERTDDPFNLRSPSRQQEFYTDQPYYGFN